MREGCHLQGDTVVLHEKMQKEKKDLHETDDRHKDVVVLLATV